MSTEPAAPIDVTARYYSENGALIFRGKTYYPVDYVFTRNDIRQAKADAWDEGLEAERDYISAFNNWREHITDHRPEPPTNPYRDN